MNGRGRNFRKQCWLLEQHVTVPGPTIITPEAAYQLGLARLDCPSEVANDPCLLACYLEGQRARS